MLKLPHAFHHVFIQEALGGAVGAEGEISERMRWELQQCWLQRQEELVVDAIPLDVALAALQHRTQEGLLKMQDMNGQGGACSCLACLTYG